LTPSGKRLGFRPLQQLVGVADAEVVAAVVLVELRPGYRRGDGRAFAAAGGVRHHRGRAALVAEPVEENAALALDLADVGGEGLRLGFGDGATEAVGEALHRRPVLRR